MKYSGIYVCVVGAVLVLLLAFSKYANRTNYTFVVAGDDRLAPADTVGNPGTTNTYHLKRLFAEVAQLKPLPEYLFLMATLLRAIPVMIP